MAGSYIIRGGLAGRERLQTLARAMRPATLDLLRRAGVGSGQTCLDLGCGGGDVARELARLAGPSGHVLGLDLDEVKLGLAREEAAALGLGNVTFARADAMRGLGAIGPVDVGYARFLLTHLRDPLAVLRELCGTVRPGGLVVLEDIEISAGLAFPPSDAFDAYTDIYRRTALARGVDPDIGPRLPVLLREAGIAPAEVSLVQPAGIDGDAKLMAPLTMEAIADAAVDNGIADAPSVALLVDALYRLAGDGRTLVSMPRVTQVWGRKG